MGVHHPARTEALRRRMVERRLSHKTAVQKLDRNLTFAVGAALPIFDADIRDSDITFRFHILCNPNFSNPIPEGILFSIGNADTGIAAWITNDFRLGFGAGTKPIVPPISNQAWTVTHTPANFIALRRNERHDLAFSARPGDGSIRAWVDGRLRLAARTNLGRFIRVGTSIWSAAAVGGYFVLPPVIPRFCPVTTIANAAISARSPLSMCLKQRPWHYDTCVQDPSSGPFPLP